jgi:hypothetical protein
MLGDHALRSTHIADVQIHEAKLPAIQERGSRRRALDQLDGFGCLAIFIPANSPGE